MTEKKQVYRCEVCGNIVEVLHTGAGELVCCKKPMVLQEEHTKDEGMEKHVPVVNIKDGSVEVIVGDVAHPMEEEHFIEWIEVSIDGKVCKRFLEPKQEPKAVFQLPKTYTNISAREYCSLHGLWSS